MGCGVGRRQGLDPALLWLCCRLAAVALIGSLAWEPSYAMGAALKSKPKKKKKKKIQNFSSPQTETLYPLSNNSSLFLPLLHLASGNL